MSEHPIQSLMATAMENIKGMIDVNTIIGDAVKAPDGSLIIPVSRVGFGFAAGGTEFDIGETERVGKGYPFGGGSGGGISITPVAFLVISDRDIRLLSLDKNTHLIDRMLDFAPDIVNKIQSAMSGNDKQCAENIPT